jgi:hypothetical protein
MLKSPRNIPESLNASFYGPAEIIRKVVRNSCIVPVSVRISETLKGWLEGVQRLCARLIGHPSHTIAR